MSTAAQTILEEIKSLTPEERREVFAGLEGISREEDAVKAMQRAALDRLYGAAKGERLLEKLLADRAKERARG